MRGTDRLVKVPHAGWRLAVLASTALAGASLGGGPAWAQYKAPIQHFPTIDMTKEPTSGNQPVTFQADSVSYDKTGALVIAEGHVEAWQNDHVLRADRVTFDRNTNVAAAYGHVVIVEPDGQVLFADYAELTQGMKQGVMTALRARMDQNAKLAANGARRTDGKLNELSRGVYSACDVCAKHPDYAPLWQIRADSIVQDLQHKRIEYYDAYLDAYGFPVMYLPYFSMSDPSVKRQSGLLTPSIGASDHYLGSFIRLPYFLVLDDQSDVTLTGTVGTEQGPQLEALYNRDFNNGVLRLDGAMAIDRDITIPNSKSAAAGYFFGHGLFDFNDTWRYGFDVDLASSVSYMRDFQVPGYGANLLGSSAFIEGFGVGSYAKLDVRAYQGLNSAIAQNLLPYVLPRYQYSYFGEPDALGGRLSIDTIEYNVLRDLGTNDQQAAAKVQWDRPFSGRLGDQWLFTLQGVGLAYNATVLDNQPGYQDHAEGRGVTGQAQVALRLNWPFVRDDGHYGHQVVEPILQVIAAPQHGNSLRDNIPNEDALDYEFTDATLFQLNRFQGYDRFDGGVRVNAALRGEWDIVLGTKIEALVGASYQQHIDANLYPEFQPWNGFEAGQHLSDIVTRFSVIPSKWVDFTVRTRIDHDNGDIRFADAITNFGPPVARFNVGFLYSATDPYELYLPDAYFPNLIFNGKPFLVDYTTPGALNPAKTNPISEYYLAEEQAFFTPRQEVSLGFSSKIDAYTLHTFAVRDVQTGHMVNAGGDIKWENNCFIFDIYASRRFTSIAGDNGDTTVLFTITLKTIGGFGING
jgi:LPS-assembly protein